MAGHVAIKRKRVGWRRRVIEAVRKQGAAAQCTAGRRICAGDDRLKRRCGGLEKQRGRGHGLDSQLPAVDRRENRATRQPVERWREVEAGCRVAAKR